MVPKSLPCSAEPETSIIEISILFSPTKKIPTPSNKQTNIKGYSYLLINLLLFLIFFLFPVISRICWDFFCRTK
jgi:hypothetical protein